MTAFKFLLNIFILVVVLPRQAAIRLVAGKDENVQQSALLQGEAYLNAQPVTIWINGEGPQLAAQPAPAWPAIMYGSLEVSPTYIASHTFS